MTSTQKFISDIQKIKKHYRQEHSTYDGLKVSEQVAELFIRNNRDFSSLASSIADYWLETYIKNNADLSESPTDKETDKLSGIQALLDNDTTLLDSLSPEDFKELCSLVNAEAEDLPIDKLSSLMSIFVEHQAF